MLYFSLFFGELVLLFLLSRNLTQVLSHVLYRITKSKRVTIFAISFLFFPGTLLHECAHAIAARLLGVQVGAIEFIPKVEGETVKLGSVQVSQSDPIRRFFIGAAPFFFGTLLLLGLLFYAAQNRLFTNNFSLVLISYAVFEIGNTMFSSKKDMEGALELFITLISLVVILYLLGIRFTPVNPNVLFSQPLIQEVFRQGSLFLLIPLAIDILIILLFKPLGKK